MVLFADLLQGWVDLSSDSIKEVQNSTDDIIAEFQTLNDGIFTGESGLSQLKTDVVKLFTDMNTEVDTEAGNVRDTIVGIFVSDADSVVNELNKALFGTTPTGETSTTSPTYGIGMSIMTGIAAGITGNQLSVSNALRNSLSFAFTEAATAIAANSPSLVAARTLGLPVSEGVAAGILAGSDMISGSLQAVIQDGIGASINSVIGSNSSSAAPSYVSNINRTTQYNLNVNSNIPSSGIISDFAILKSVAI